VADYLVFGQTIGTITFEYCHQSALTCSAAPSTATAHRLLFGAMVKSPSVNHPSRSARQPIKVAVPALWYQLHACLDTRQTCQPVISRSTSQHPQNCKQRTCCGPLLHFEPAPKHSTASVHISTLTASYQGHPPPCPASTPPPLPARSHTSATVLQQPMLLL
jgi:hypothetical protein